MKQNILYHSLVAGLFLLLIGSCVQKEELPQDDSFALILQTSVSSPATKAEVPSVTSLKEDAVDLLNVYFYGTFSGDASPSIKHYTLSSATDKTGATSWKVSKDWRADGFVPGNSYDVYVSANSRKVKTAAESNDKSVATGSLASASITDLAGLKSMIEFDYDPSEDNGEGGHKPYWGAYNEDNLNPEWLDLHKKYIPDATFDVSTGNSQQKRYYANEKSFLMDGKTTFTAGSTEAIPLELVRAAAKVVVDVKFSNDFLTSLTAKNVEVTGAPAWRFYNFSFSTPVFDPSLITGAAVNYNKSIFVAGGIMMGNDAVDTDLVYTDADKHFTFATYTYPLSWTAGSASSEAPAIILSLGYKDTSTDVITYQTYKIPVVDPEGGVTAIGRNKLYKIEATIASEGGELLTDAYKVRCNYDIIPWGAIPVDSKDIADVDHSDNDYFDVSPTHLILRGNGQQDGEFRIIKPNKRSYKIQYWDTPGASIDDPFAASGSDSRTDYPFLSGIAENKPAPYYFNYNGTRRKVFADTKSKDGITYGTDTYLQNKFVYGEKSLEVESYFLPNMATKYMKIRIYLDVDGWEAKGLYKDVTVCHYPSDQISHTIGAWSSRISACSALDPTNPNYEPFSASTGPYGPEEYTYNTSTSKYELNPDHVPTSNYQVSNYSQHYTNYRNQRWVNYDIDKSGTHYFRVCSNANNLNSNNAFRPKYWNGSTVYQMNASIYQPGNTSGTGNPYGGVVQQGTERPSDSRNPRMYIVQVASTSSSHVTGRPTVNEDTGLSEDEVFSPAFMVASQLGATAIVGTSTGTISKISYGIDKVKPADQPMWAARHCQTYLEVGADGTYYKNWRLPTKDEIGVIVGLQNETVNGVTIDGDDRILYPVLVSRYYIALDGTSVLANESNTDTKPAIRCVRDLTQAEIDALNN